MPSGVIQVNTEVILNGVSMGSQEVSWSASITNDLPGRFTASDTIPQRTGTIVWDSHILQDGNVIGISKDVSPLDPEYPMPGDTVVVKASTESDGIMKVKTVFTGLVDRTAGGMGKNLTSTIIDDSDQLNTSVSWYPLMSSMPRRQRTSWKTVRPGCTPHYVLGEVINQTGFSANYANNRHKPILHATLQGSMFTDYVRGDGALTAAGFDPSDNSGFPKFTQYPNIGAMGLQEGVGAWDNDKYSTLADNGFWIDCELYSPTDDTYLYIGARFNDTTVVQFGITGGALWAYTKTSGAQEWVMDSPKGTDQYFKVGLYYPKNVGDPLWIRVNDDYRQLGLKRTDADNTILSSNGNVAQGVNVSGLFLDKKRSGIVRDVFICGMDSDMASVNGWRSIMDSRVANRSKISIPNVPALNYIAGAETETGKAASGRICEPFCISSWIDGAGILHFESGDYLRSRPTVKTLTEADFEPLEWSSEYTYAASNITITGKNSELKMVGSGELVQSVFEGESSDTFNAANTLVMFYNVPADEDVFEVDTVPKNLNMYFRDFANAIGLANQEKIRNQDWWWGVYSVFGIATNDKNIDRNSNTSAVLDYANPDDIFCTVDRIAPKTYKIEIGYIRNRRTDSSPKMPSVFSESMNNASMENKGSPIIRAGAHMQMYNANPITRTTAGPKGPELIHDMGVYAQNGGQYVADMLKEYFNTAHPVFSDVTLPIDTDLDVGMNIVLDSTERWGYKFTVQITKITHDVSNQTTKITPRVISYTRTRRLYRDVESEFRNYEAVETVGTYQQLSS